MESFQAAMENMSPAMLFPVAVVFFLMLFYIYYVKILQPERGTSEWIDMELSAEERHMTLLNFRFPLEKSDIAPMILITVIFLMFGVSNLGSSTPIDVAGEIAARAEGGTLYEGHNHINNMYFDEIYFVRTAVEHINSPNATPAQHHSIYEWTHPPLGKNIIAASILLFGESPFGWRLIGAICGALMLLVMYAFVKNMFGKTSIAACAALLLGFDFMRLVQSRIGTIDTYAVLFILLAYYFMYRYITTDPDAPFRKSLPSLALSGLFFGLSFSVKWIGFYAGAGLFIIYIHRLYQLGMFYSTFEKRGFPLYFINTILFSLLFFVIVPAGIYYLNYIPYGFARGMTLEGGMLFNPDFLSMVWSNQESMLGYHANLDATHGGSSVWWQWLFDIKPILYVNNYAEGTRATYGAFGNPVLYWGGLAAMIAVAIRMVSYRDGKAYFILIGFLAQLLPWVAVTRVVFAYHYLPSTLFLVLALAYVFNAIFERGKMYHEAYVYGFTAVTGATFLMFFPMLAGVYLPHWYYSYFAKWLPSWPF